MANNKRKCTSSDNARKKSKTDATRKASGRSRSKETSRTQEGGTKKRGRSFDTPKTKKLKRAPALKTRNCPRCKVTLFSSDADSLCCGRTLKSPEPLISLPKVSEALLKLFVVGLFAQHCRQYNNHFAFSAIASTHGVERIPGGPSNLILHGRMYHRILPGQHKTGPLRFFLYDGMSDSLFDPLNEEWNAIIRNDLASCSPFWNKLKQLATQNARYARLEITVTESREIAAVIVIDPNEPIKRKTIVYWRHSEDEPVFVNPNSELYLPLQYVLIAPDGSPGWSVKYKETHKISQLAYYRQLMMRHKPLHMLGPLLNEYLVDMFSAVETDRLNFLRSQQKRVVKKIHLSQLRRDETVTAEGSIEPGRTYLTSDFLGSPRHQQKLVADALAIVKRFGKPTYFITMSCNPKWPEIVSQLLPGQTAADRPDITARVFHGKLAQLFEMLPKALKANKIIYRIHVIEFQKRGLPHAHIAVKLDREPQTAEEIDAVISACIPRHNDQLKRIVESLYIHSCRPERCHKKQKSSSSSSKVYCCQGYPHKLCSKTYIDHAGYARYRRELERDQSVVSYNEELTFALDCHINIDLSCTVLLIMYLYKYFYKGVDHAKFKLNVEDEITEYQNSRLSSGTITTIQAARSPSARSQLAFGWVQTCSGFNQS